MSSIDKARADFAPTYRQPEFVIERGEGVMLFDDRGNRYLDAIAGIAVNSLGHNDEELVRAVATQAARITHTSNLYWTAPSMELSGRLVAATFAERVFFANSGAEANEAMLKAARRAHYDAGSKRFEFITATNSFHGRTMATVTLTGQPKYHKGFEPMLPGVSYVPYGDLEAMAAAITDHTAAIMVEPIQGEGGVVVPPLGYLKGLRDLADRSGCFLLFDEVQTGVGRTGDFLGCDHEGVAPDGASLAKGLGGGLPVGAFLAGSKLASCLVPGTHASTFGGNPVACAAANVVLRRLTEGGLIEHVRAMGAKMDEAFAPLIGAGKPAVCLRGRGLLRGLELAGDPLPDLPAVARQHGLMIGMVAGGQVVRLAPPLIIDAEQIERLASLLGLALEEALHAASA
jgi:predicted acetylornithine/succinylornithine family transaminase